VSSVDCIDHEEMESTSQFALIIISSLDCKFEEDQRNLNEHDNLSLHISMIVQEALWDEILLQEGEQFLVQPEDDLPHG
jgi:hypothetical protein